MLETRTDNPDGTYTITQASGRKITYNPDGTPCKACNTLLDFKSSFAMTPKKVECPPDGGQIGRGTWTLLHLIAAKYPDSPSEQQKKDVTLFLTILGRIYPCWTCASDFQEYMKENAIKADSKDVLGKWLCDAHNEVNVKLGKPKFDCNIWKKRWKDGGDDC